MRVVFIGTGDIGLPVIRYLLQATEHELVGVITQPDKPVGREQRITPSPIKAAVAGSGIPVLQPDRIKHPVAVAEIQKLEPAVIVVMAYGQILPRTVLEIPAIACLNLHASLLPRHRGAAPIQAAIMSGDRETGITVMYMDEGLDTGDILLQTAIEIAPDETGGSLHDRLAEMAPDALQRALGLFAHGTAHRTSQEFSQATYAPKLEREHGFIDWSKAAEVIERQIRAFDPWPSAHTILHDSKGGKRKLKIFRAEVVKPEPPLPIGCVRSESGAIAVGTGADALLLQELQLEGKKRMQASEFVRGNASISGATVLSAP